MTSFNSSYHSQVLLVILFAVGVQFTSAAQCKTFTKKRCMGQLEPYSNNGQYNGAVMFEGEQATIAQTFYSQQDYRIVLCTQPILGEGVYFEVSDFRDNPIYSTEGTGEMMWEFNVESTQQLKIKVVVPESENPSELKLNGCVSILIGFKNEATGFIEYDNFPGQI